MTNSIVLAGPAAETTRIISFWILAIIAVGAALGMVLARKAVHCAILLAVVMLSLAILYLMLGAPFLALVQIIVYTGAVLMLFLFVLMIVGISAADSIIETIRGQRFWAFLAGIAMFVLLVLTIGHAVLTIGPAGKSSAQFGNANVTSLAHLIFTRYVFPFEITSALLITAAVGAMVLAHRERLRPKLTQRQMAEARIASGHPTPLPGPGTYAQHNAVDMPALLPDGSQSELSVSPVLTGGRSASAGRPPALGGPQQDGTPAVTRGQGSAAGAAAGQEAGDE